MPDMNFKFREDDCIRMILEFLQNRELGISQLSLERETGVYNGFFSDDMLFLRQLVLDGQWDDVFQFISPLEPIETFQTKEVHYLINKYKYIELLCIRAEVGPFQNAEVAVKEIVSCLNELEKYCPTKEDYNQFCLLLTLQNLDQHADYKNWNPSNSRVHCFNKLCPYLEPFLPVTRKPGQSAPKTAKNDRLVQLIIKGILYESCVEYCQRKATASTTSLPVDLDYSGLLDSVGFTNADLSLLSWLQSIPGDTFNFPFQDRTLNVQIEKLNKPSLMATWSEMILVSPIKPCVFPHSATPFTRVKAADLMSKSLSSANVDHLSKSVMSFSLKDAANLSQSSIAGAEFHLSGTVESSEKNVNEKQVERMFEEGNVFNSSLFGKLQTIRESTDALTHALNTDSVCGTSPAVCPSFSTHTPLLASNGKTESAQTNYWRQFQKKKDEHHQDLQQLDSLAMPSGHFNGNCVRFTPTIQESETNDRSKYCTPEGQLGQKNFTDMKKLMTSTPKGSKAMLSTTELMQINHQLDFSNASSIKENRTLISQCNSTAATPCNTTERNSSTDSIGLTCATSTLSTSTTQQPSLTSISSMSSVKSNQTMKSTNGRPPPVTQWQQALINQTPVTATFASSSVSIIQSHHHHHPQQNQAPPALGITSVAASPPSFPATMPAPWLISSQNGTNRAGHTSLDSGVKSTSSMQLNGKESGAGSMEKGDQQQRKLFIEMTRLEDVQAIRAIEFHPNGRYYAVGSNSKKLRICAYPDPNDFKTLTEDHITTEPVVALKRLNQHSGSIYCLAWNPSGDLLATGSNDKTIRLMRFDEQTCDLPNEMQQDLMMHDGTIRDMCFMQDRSNNSNLLISGGAGDCKIYVTDCETGIPFHSLTGHSGHILSLYTWGGAVFVSGSQDRTIRFWDLRTRGCVNLITAPSVSGQGAGGAVGSVSVDPSGRLLVSGHEDASCMLYDIRGQRVIQTFRPHDGDIRTVRFSPKAYYLLSGGYDHNVVLTDLQGDLTQPLPSLVVARHRDKVIQAKWHPTEFNFLTTSADKSAALWALPS